MRIPKVGDIMKAPSGALRIVRSVTCRSRRERRKIWIVFTIKHCSWTHRPVTTYSLGELQDLGYVHTRKNITLSLPSDKVIEAECSYPDNPQLSCCDVVGVP